MTRDRNCEACGGSGLAEDPVTRRPVGGKCPTCAMTSTHGPPLTGAATTIRGQIVERARQPGEWTVEDVLRWTRFAGSPAIGGVTSALARAGVIVRVGVRQSDRNSRNGGTAAVWIGRPFSGRSEQLQVIP